MRSLTLALVGLFVAVALAPPALATGVAVGTLDLVDGGCPAPDAVVFTLDDNGDGSWTFTVVDVGLATCYWAQTDELRGVGSPAAGFTGQVVSGPWTLNADGTFSVSGLRMIFPTNGGTGLGGGYSVEGDANGVFVN